MKLYYFSPYDVLRARTNSISDIRLCDGFARNEAEVNLICPYIYRRDNLKRGEITEYYGITSQYKITILKTPLLDGMSRWVSQPLMLIFNLFMVAKILITNTRSLSDTVIMSRSPVLLTPVIIIKKTLGLKNGPKVIAWAHEVIYKNRHLWVYRNSDGVVGTNSAITDDLHEKVGIDRRRLAISLNPINDRQIRSVNGRKAARMKLRLEVDSPLVVYTGKVGYGLREINYILEAASRLPQYDFLLTGGKPEAVVRLREICSARNISNVTFTGFMYRYEDVLDYQSAASVLVSYYSKFDHLTRYNLPNKICEYMLTRNPIVTCNFPATRDVLNENNAIFVEAEQPNALAGGIQFAIEHRIHSQRVADQAYDDVMGMTFSKITNRLLVFFSHL